MCGVGILDGSAVVDTGNTRVFPALKNLDNQASSKAVSSLGKNPKLSITVEWEMICLIYLEDYTDTEEPRIYLHRELMTWPWIFISFGRVLYLLTRVLFDINAA